MRNEFHDTLDTLVADLSEMCDRASAMMRSATTALLFTDADAGRRLRADLTHLTALAASVNDRAYRLLALQAPVARDLRTVVAALHIGADADRMGALASHVARVAARTDPEPAVPAEVADLFTEMGTTAVRMAGEARDAVRGRDADLAEKICAGDARMDELHRQLLVRVAAPQWRHGPLVAADMVLLGRFYERFADHAVEIARRVYFQATGSSLVGGSGAIGLARQRRERPHRPRENGVGARRLTGPENYFRSNRSLFITFTHAATKSSTNLPLLSSCA
ncbi:phosphate signaling complex protein PhoU [Mycolicibacterium sp. 018/SC-01/001]|uniref:phosphate signaling complex protein PhoU n=1 Tax=Mycolicibacterium sp. 018/SC-01/001 TaxID=2592069 RepID=UPI00117F8225|nr:phosphate signaling complex protein PhoU [Mycolicibacterium sp. 018/SC-01/001]TRW76535.1 phosphate signaling complex protein PhoU [Mycolicibacterium sp. 018/SC-01/001]